MSQNKSLKKAKAKKPYVNPANTKAGKILVLVLVLAMVAASIATLIYYLITMGKAV